MGIENKCTKHSILQHKEIPAKFRAVLEKIEKEPDTPTGHKFDSGKCPLCVYYLGFKDGLKDAGK